MSRRLAAIAALCAVLVPPVAAPAAKGLATTAAEVVARNEKARGGVEAWRRVETMVWLGHLERADQNHAGFVIGM